MVTATPLPALPILLATLGLTLAIALWSAVPRGHSRPLRLKVLMRAFLPSRMLRSASGRLDVIAFLFAILFATMTLGWALVSANWWAGRTAALIGPAPVTLPAWVVTPMATVALFLTYELAYWGYHLLSHRVAWLWAFHKVHHSAESLSLLTNFRVHPVDTIIFYNVAALMTGVVGGLIVPLNGQAGQWTVGNANLLVFTSSILLSYLQHSHLWISWPGRLGRWLMSPAHHQLHHSVEQRHHGHNFGSTLSLFDRMAGTLLLPTRRRQRLRFGVEDAGDAPHGFKDALLRPFGEAIRTLSPHRPASVVRKMSAKMSDGGSTTERSARVDPASSPRLWRLDTLGEHMDAAGP